MSFLPDSWCVLSSIILPKPPFQNLLNLPSLYSNFPALGDNQEETNTNHFQKCLHASLVEGRRGRKETLGSKKEVFRLEEYHNKIPHTDRDHTPPPDLGINKKPFKFEFQTGQVTLGCKVCLGLRKGQ